MSERTCTLPGCSKPYTDSGFCAMHRYRWKRYGDPNYVRLSQDADQRFAAGYLIVPSGCWEWQRDLTPEGYARWFVNRVRIGVHRWAYERYVGPIPPGLVIDHLCRNPRCVNPAHLEPVTQRENVLRGPSELPAINAGKTHCIRGHELAGDNLIIRNYGPHPARQCRTCSRARWNAANRRRRSRSRASTWESSSGGLA